MSQPTKSHPGASCAGDSTNHLTEGSEKSSAVNAQPRGFITPNMRPTMGPAMSADRRSQVQSTRSIVGAPESASSQLRGFTTSTMNPMMTVGQGSQLRPTSGQNGAPESASSQLRGLTTSPPGEHLWQSSPSNRCPSPPSVRTISLCSVSCPTPAHAVDRPAKVSIPVNVVIDDDIRPGHGANERPTSPVPASGRVSTVASSIRRQVERERRTATPEGARFNFPSLGLDSFAEWQKSGSKIDNPLSGSCRRGRWPRSEPVPEILSAALRWAK
jgi:hypothetical protein